MSDNKEDKILTKWLNGELSDEELSKERGAVELLKYQQILNEIDQWTPDNEEVIFQLPNKEKETKVIKMSKWTAISIAASISLVAFLSLWFLTASDRVEHMASFGETKEITLPDGLSRVTLSANARVSWKTSKWDKNLRQVKLNGKAYFDVEPGSPFKVLSTNGDVEVLGTTFDVNAYDESLDVVCYTGKVRATANDHSSQDVNGGEAILFHEGNWEEKTSIIDATPSWIGSEIKFSNAPLNEVLISLASEYDLTFEKSGVNSDRRFSGSVPKDDLNSALQIVFTPLGIQFDQKNKRVILKD